MYMTICHACYKRIVWLKTADGTLMACDVKPCLYRACEDGTKWVLNQKGVMVRCELTDNRDEATDVGLLPHLESCNKPDLFRKREKSNDTETE